jgi:Flp pilus assembly protein TadG
MGFVQGAGDAMTNTLSTARLNRLHRLATRNSGQTVVETALVLPTFFLLIFGFMQYSIVLFTYCNATFACRYAARSASVCSSTSLSPATVSHVQGLVTSRLFLNGAITPTVGVTYLTPALATGSNTVGNYVEVSVTWSQTVKVPFMANQSVSIGTQGYRTITR